MAEHESTLEESLPPEAPSRRAKIVARLLLPLAPALIAAACSGEPHQDTDAELYGEDGTELALDIPRPGPDSSPAEQAAYWASGRSDGRADNGELQHALGFAQEATGDDRVRAFESVSEGAANSTRYYARGRSDGRVDDGELRHAEELAQLAEMTGSYGASAHRAAAAGARNAAEFWANGGSDGRVNEEEQESADEYTARALEHEQHADSLE